MLIISNFCTSLWIFKNMKCHFESMTRFLSYLKGAIIKFYFNEKKYFIEHEVHILTMLFGVDEDHVQRKFTLLKNHIYMIKQ